MDINQMKSIVRNFWYSIGDRQFSEAFSLCSESLVYTLNGKFMSPTPFTRTATERHFSDRMAELFPDGYKLDEKGVMAEGDTVVLEAVTQAVHKSGKPYNNTVSIWHDIRNGKIHTIHEYNDTQLNFDLFNKW